MVTPGQLNRRAQLYNQLGSVIAAGVPLVQALEMASRNNSLRGSRKTILALIGDLQAGRTFSDSMARVHGWMPEFDVALLSVGEKPAASTPVSSCSPATMNPAQKSSATPFPG